MKIRTKLIIVCLLFLIVPSLIIGLIGENSAKQSLDAAGKTGLKNDVKMALKLIDSMDNEVKAGHISLKDAQERVKTLLIGPMKDHKRPIDKSIDIGANGYFFVLDKKGVEVAHPSIEGKNIWAAVDPNGVKVAQEIIKNGTNGGGYTEYQWPLPNSKEIAPKITYSELDPHWGWIVIAGSYMKDYNSSANHIFTIILITMGVSLLLGLAAILLFAGHLSKPIKNMAQQVKKVAHGDLTIEALKVKNKDEIGQLATDFNEMVINLKKVIGQVLDSSHQVSSTSEELAASSEQTSQAAEQIAQSIQEVATGADKQRGSSLDASDSVLGISNRMDSITHNIESVTSTSVETSHAAENGNVVVNKAIEQMSIINTQSTEMVNKIVSLGNKSEEIADIITLITDIANQTNLLALNASIEAARAGEHGKGFAVVAGEVRKLAEQTGNAAGNINSLIQEIQTEITHAVTSMEQGDASVKEGIIFVNQAGESFQGIAKEIDRVAQQMQEVIAVNNEINTDKAKLVESIERVTHIAEQSAEYSQNVAASAEEQNASMEEVSAAASTLAKIADTLKESIKVFKI